MVGAPNKPLITYQTGTDESYLIGTKEQLITFSEAIISAVNDAKSDQFFGQNIQATHLVESILDNKSEIALDEIVVVDTNETKDAIFYEIYNS